MLLKREERNFNGDPSVFVSLNPTGSLTILAAINRHCVGLKMATTKPEDAGPSILLSGGRILEFLYKFLPPDIFFFPRLKLNASCVLRHRWPWEDINLIHSLYSNVSM
jgi:hypothetical protein